MAAPSKKSLLAFGAWQPLTPSGVAAFAQSSGGRTLALKSIVVALAVTVVIWLAHTAYVPAIEEAISHAPETAALGNRQVTNLVSGPLAQKKFLSIIVDLERTRAFGQTSDVQAELHTNQVQFCSLFGCAQFDYPAGQFPLGRSALEPWWGARKPVLFAILGIGTLAIVWLTWFGLALAYAPIAKIIAYFMDRHLTWVGSWRLASAAQMPGALLMCLSIFLYGIQVLDLIRFLILVGLHFLVAWFYVIAAPTALPPHAKGVATNPFDKQ